MSLITYCLFTRLLYLLCHKIILKSVYQTLLKKKNHRILYLIRLPPGQIKQTKYLLIIIHKHLVVARIMYIINSTKY